MLPLFVFMWWEDFQKISRKCACVGWEVEGFSFRLNGWQQYYARNYEKKCNDKRTWWSGYCHEGKVESDLNQSKVSSFVEQDEVASNSDETFTDSIQRTKDQITANMGIRIPKRRNRYFQWTAPLYENDAKGTFFVLWWFCSPLLNREETSSNCFLPGEPKTAGHVTITHQMLASIAWVFWDLILHQFDKRW